MSSSFYFFTNWYIGLRHLFVGRARKNLKLNEYSCKLSELKELCLMSPYVKFILVFTNYYANGKLPFVRWDGTKICFFKLNQYSCKLFELKVLCLVTLCQVHFNVFELVGQRQILKIALLYVGRARKYFDFFKVNKYPCKLFEIKELCHMSPYVKFILFFTNW